MDETGNVKDTEESPYKTADKESNLSGSDKFVDIKKNGKWKKKALGFFIVITVILAGGVAAILLLQFKGGKNLRAEEKHIVYNGKEYKYREEIINILCMGIDKKVPMDYIIEERDNIGMADVILLVSINTKKNDIEILMIPRDTMTEIQVAAKSGEARQKERMQICYQYAYGRWAERSAKWTVEAVSKLLYDTPIQRYCAVNLDAVSKLNDAIGGVDVLVEEDIEEWDANFKYGEKVHLDGRLALRFIRTRNRYRVDGNVLRTQRQKQYALAFVEKAKSVIAKDPTLVLTVLQELEEDKNISTNITVEDISYLMPKVLKMSFSGDNIRTLPGESELGEDELVEYYMDVDAVKELIINTFYKEV